MRITAAMQRFVIVANAVLCVSMLGCKPDAALHNGEVIDNRPSTSSQNVNKTTAPEVIEPKTDRQRPVKQVP